MRIMFILSTFLSQFSSCVKASNGCRNLIFLDCVKDKALVNHTVETSMVPSPGQEHCQFKCFLNNACVSYNLGPPEGLMRSCEISDTDHVGHRDHVPVPKKGFVYCAIRNPCSSSPCANDELCKPDFSWDSYQCIDNVTWCRQHTQCPVYRVCAKQPATQSFECQPGFSPICSKPLGMEDKRIADSSITGSSFLSSSHAPYRARLNNNATGDPKYSSFRASSWVSANQINGQYLQVDLGKVFYVTKVATQGSSDANWWVKTYTLKYSLDETAWLDYRQSRGENVKVFLGNTDENTVVEHLLHPEPIKSQFIRFVALEWNIAISMRVELYGCKV